LAVSSGTRAAHLEGNISHDDGELLVHTTSTETFATADAQDTADSSNSKTESIETECMAIAMQYESLYIFNHPPQSV